jgi:hypothetical protein
MFHIACFALVGYEVNSLKFEYRINKKKFQAPGIKLQINLKSQFFKKHGLEF